MQLLNQRNGVLRVSFPHSEAMLPIWPLSQALADFPIYQVIIKFHFQNKNKNNASTKP